MLNTTCSSSPGARAARARRRPPATSSRDRVRAGPVLEERGRLLDDLREPTGRIGSSLTREKSVSVRVIASTRAMFDEMLARPRSKISGEAPRFDCRICTIEWIAASGLLTSWQTPATMKPSEASRVVCAICAAQVVEHRDDRVRAGPPHREPFADGAAVRRAHDVQLARRREVAGEHGVIVGKPRGEASRRRRRAGLHRRIRRDDAGPGRRRSRPRPGARPGSRPAGSLGARYSLQALVATCCTRALPACRDRPPAAAARRSAGTSTAATTLAAIAIIQTPK